MTEVQAPNSNAQRSKVQALDYGLFGLPLSLVALSIYVHLPASYAQNAGLSLASLGTLLLLTRLFDMAIDPALGRWVDALFANSVQHFQLVFVAACLVMYVGFCSLWFAPTSWGLPVLWAWLACALILVYSSYSLLSILHLSWAAKASRGAAHLNQLNASRELFAMCGVLFASAAPLLMGVKGTVLMLAACLIVSAIRFYPLLGATKMLKHGDLIPTLPPRLTSTITPTTPPRLAPQWLSALRSVRFRLLLLVFLLNALASAIPATLMIFFSQDVLNAAAWTPYFLLAYFLCAAACVPLWLKAIARFGLYQCWLVAIFGSVSIFIACFFLASGDRWWFVGVCMATGLCLGADLLIPPAMLASVINKDGGAGLAEGSYFSWWTVANKLSLALAAGLCLPLLEWWGYKPSSTALGEGMVGVNTAQNLLGLSITYALIPCFLKLLAGISLYYNRSYFKGDTP